MIAPICDLSTLRSGGSAALTFARPSSTTSSKPQAWRPAPGLRKLAAVKSLAAFGYRLGNLPSTLDAPSNSPDSKHTLAERILTEVDVHHMLALEPVRRNHVLLQLLYIAGLRVSKMGSVNQRNENVRREGRGGLRGSAGVPSGPEWQHLVLAVSVGDL